MTTIRADDIIDRQRLRRKVTFWRVLAFLAVLATIILAISRFISSESLQGKSADHVAKVKIQGAITEDEELLERLEKISKSEAVKGVILSIDSPGGTTSGGEAIYESIRKIAEKKPVVAQVGTLAASAGYMVASASDQIVARKSSIVGSIGVIFQYPNFQTFLENLGVDIRAIKSSPLKAEPGFYGQTPPEAEEMIQAMISDSYDWFKNIVKERRNFDTSEIERLADGSVFTGRQAHENGLVDQLGGETAARAWLTQKGVDEKLNIVEWARERQRGGLLPAGFAMHLLMNLVGFSDGQLPLNDQLHNRLMLDGLLSIWHGAGK